MSHQIVPLDDGTLDSTQIWGGVGGPINLPPVQDSPIPPLQLQATVPFSYDLSQHFSHPQGKTMTYSGDEIPGMNIASDGMFTGTPTAEGTVTDNPLTVRDTDNQTLDTQYSTTVGPAPDPGPPGAVWNWPNMTSVWCLNGQTDVFGDTAPPTQQLITWRVTACMIQGGVGVNTPGDRRAYKARTQTYKDNRLGVAAAHLDCHQVNGLRRPSSTARNRIAWDAVLVSNGDWIVWEEYSDPNNPSSIHWMGRSTKASLATRQLAMDHTQAGYRSFVIDAWFNYYQNPNADEYLGDRIEAIHHDAMSDWLRRNYCKDDYNEDIISISGRELTVPDWPGLPLGGDPDGNGFETVTTNYWGWLYSGTAPGVSNRQINDMSEIKKIERAKRIGGGQMVILASEDLEGRVSSSWRLQIMRASGTTSCAAFKRDGSRQCQNGANQLDPNAENYWRVTQGYEKLFDDMDARYPATRAAQGLEGKTFGYVPNGIAGDLLSFANGPFDIRNHAWRDKQDWGQCEHIDDGTSDDYAFTADTGQTGYNYGLRRLRDHQWYFGRHHLAKSHMQKGAPKGLEFVGWTGSTNVNTRSPRNNWSDVDFAFMAFYHIYMVMGSGGFGLFNGHHSYRQQLMTELLIWAPGGPPIDPLTLTTTKTPLANWSFLSNVDETIRGLEAFTPMPSHWGGLGGTGQYEMWWPATTQGVLGEISIINARLVNNRILQWAPHWLPGGVSLDPNQDYYTIHDLPPGYGLYRRDWSTYRNPTNNENVREGIYAVADQGLGRLEGLFDPDPSTPDGLGAYLGTNGAQVPCGVGGIDVFAIAPEPS